MNSHRKKTPDDYYALAEQRGFRWIGPEVATTKTLTTWECPQGHRWQAIYNNIQQGRHCPQCSRRKRPGDFHLVAEKRGYVWLGPEVTSMDALTSWQCQNAHRWKATYREILRGDSCPDCQNEEEQHQAGIIDVSNEFIFTEHQEEMEVETEEPIIFDANEFSSSPLQLDWWDSRAIKYLLQFFSQAKFLIRFSTGFFSIPGYNLIRPAVGKKRVNVLVGYDERSRQELRDLLIDEIMDDLSRWHANRFEVVKHLIDKIQSNEFILLDARTRRRDHSKIFIFDESYVVGGSINLTRNGLISNAEADLAITAEREPERVNEWIEKFEGYWNAPDTEDLTEKLLESLLAFLSLRRPWDIYLKTIQALAPREKPRSPRPSYRMPVEYQMVVVNRALRQLSNHHGAMVVASTGLGKTIIGTHIAYVLQHIEQRILNVLVIAPTATKKEWRRRLRSAGISADAVYTRDNLDRRLNKERKQDMLRELLEALDDVDDRWLIIVDESQYFRNLERSGGGERLSFIRLIEAIRNKKCLVLLLTATPYSTELDNINHQLLLIPHTRPKKRTHQMPFPGYETGKEYLNAWRVEHVDELINLPVATVISTAYVAQNFSVSSNSGDYLLFGEERRYIPRIQVSKLEIPVFMEEVVGDALDSHFFQHALIHIPIRGRKTIPTRKLAEQQVNIAWGSSPQALAEVLEKCILPVKQGGYNYPFDYSLEERINFISPVLETVQLLDYTEDEKFMKLYALTHKFWNNGEKILIYTERLATAVYLEKGFQKLLPSLRLACTVKHENGEYRQKDFKKEAFDLMVGFAPIANSENGEELPNLYDVFITTDAYAEGVNLQDASVVIHYDIAWTPDKIIQRAGRILRFWPTPRLVRLILFAGIFKNPGIRKNESLGQERRLRELIRRNYEAEKFSEISFIPEDVKQFDTLRGLSNIKLERLGEIGIRELEDERFHVSPFLTHLTALRQNEPYANELPDDIVSALVVNRIKKPYLYTLLRYRKTYYWMFYDINESKIRYLEEDELLARIQCTPNDKPPFVDRAQIEEQRRACINLWFRQMKLSEAEQQQVRHICSLYLTSREEQGNIQNLIN